MTEPAADNMDAHVSRAPGARIREQDWEILIQQIAKGDQQALEALYDATSPLVYGLALRILGDRAAAEEVTIDVYTQVWCQAAVYNPERGIPSTWLLILTRSRAIDRLRSYAQDHRHTELHAAVAVPTAASTPEEASVAAKRRRLVQAAFVVLAPEQREVIELAYFSGLSHSEIATKLGQPLGTVKTRARLGMTKLRELLQPLVE